MAATDQMTHHPGDRVRAFLAKAGLTVGDAAARAGVSRQQLTRLLGRKSALSSEMALRLESVFGLSASALMAMQMESDLRLAREALRETLAGLSAPGRSRGRSLKDDVLRRLRAKRRELEAAGVARLVLFGSVARGEATDRSDVDLYFEASPGASIGLVELGRLRTRIEKILGRRVDLVPGDSFRPAVRSRVEQDAVPVF